MQASRVFGYINKEGHLVVDVPLSLPPGEVEVIVLSTRTCQKKHVSTKTKSLQESAIKETKAQTSYTSE